MFVLIVRIYLGFWDKYYFRCLHKKMEKIQLFKFKKTSFRLLIGAAIFFLLFGIGDFVIAINDGFNFEFLGDWMSVIFVIQGILYFFMAREIRQRAQLFIGCDDVAFKYLIPKSKTVQSVAIADLKQLRMDGIDIYFQVKGTVHHIRLEGIEWQKLNRIKAFINDLSLRINQHIA